MNQPEAPNKVVHAPESQNMRKRANFHSKTFQKKKKKLFII